MISYPLDFSKTFPSSFIGCFRYWLIDRLIRLIDWLINGLSLHSSVDCLIGVTTGPPAKKQRVSPSAPISSALSSSSFHPTAAESNGKSSASTLLASINLSDQKMADSTTNGHNNHGTAADMNPDEEPAVRAASHSFSGALPGAHPNSVERNASNGEGLYCVAHVNIPAWIWTICCRIIGIGPLIDSFLTLVTVMVDLLLWLIFADNSV